MTYTHALLKISHVFYHSPEQVFDLWLDEHHAGSWLFGGPEQRSDVIRIDAKVGGRFFAKGRRAGKTLIHQGQFHVLQRPSQILFSVSQLADDFEPDLIQVKFERSPFGCEVQLTHQQSSPMAHNRNALIESWTHLFARMAMELNDSAGARSVRPASPATRPRSDLLKL